RRAHPTLFPYTTLFRSKVNVEFLDMFGRAPRESPCECERSSEVRLAQTLSLINGPTISNAIAHSEGLVARLIARKPPTAKIVEEDRKSTRPNSRHAKTS